MRVSGIQAAAGPAREGGVGAWRCGWCFPAGVEGLAGVAPMPGCVGVVTQAVAILWGQCNGRMQGQVWGLSRHELEQKASLHAAHPQE